MKILRMAVFVVVAWYLYERCVAHEQFPTWKTIVVGEYKNAHEYIGALQIKGVNVGERAKYYLRNIPYSQTFKEYRLVKASIQDLGFGKPTNLHNVWQKVNDVGILPPAEVAPALRLQYDDQKKGEKVWVFSYAMKRGDNDESYFYLFSDEEQQLGAQNLHRMLLEPKDIIIFLQKE